MHPIIEANRQQIADICRRSGVRRLEVFGSAARDDFDALHSDIDFLVELSDDPQASPLDSYFDLKDALEGLFSRPIDLVSRGSITNPYLQASIDRDRRLVYPA
jgi:predicted nucleotidyltransferase